MNMTRRVVYRPIPASTGNLKYVMMAIISPMVIISPMGEMKPAFWRVLYPFGSTQAVQRHRPFFLLLLMINPFYYTIGSFII